MVWPIRDAVSDIRAHLRLEQNASQRRETAYGLSPGKRCQLRWSTQHWRAVYSLAFRIPMSFWVVDSSAARHGRAALANNQTGRCLAGSIAAGADWCFRWCRVARDFVDRRSRLALSWLP